ERRSRAVLETRPQRTVAAYAEHGREDADSVGRPGRDAAPSGGGALLDDDGVTAARRRAAPHEDVRLPPERDERKPEGDQRRLRPVACHRRAAEIEPGLVGARAKRQVAKREPDDQADAGAPHPVEPLGDPASFERGGDAGGVGWVRVPRELGGPEL